MDMASQHSYLNGHLPCSSVVVSYVVLDHRFFEFLYPLIVTMASVLATIVCAPFVTPLVYGLTQVVKTVVLDMGFADIDSRRDDIKQSSAPFVWSIAGASLVYSLTMDSYRRMMTVTNYNKIAMPEDVYMQCVRDAKHEQREFMTRLWSRNIILAAATMIIIAAKNFNE